MRKAIMTFIYEAWGTFWMRVFWWPCIELDKWLKVEIEAIEKELSKPHTDKDELIGNGQKDAFVLTRAKIAVMRNNPTKKEDNALQTKKTN